MKAQNEFIDYQSFDSMETARFVLLDILEANQIDYTIYRDEYRQDVILGKGINSTEVWVRLRPADFARTNQLFEQDAEQRYEAIPADYYLRELTHEELLDILKKPDEWSIDDYVIAKKLLKEANILPDSTTLQKWRDERLLELKEIKRNDITKAENVAMGGGYLTKGMHMQNASIVNPQTGERLPVFNEKERSRGKTLTAIGIALFFIYLFFRYFYNRTIY